MLLVAALGTRPTCVLLLGSEPVNLPIHKTWIITVFTWLCDLGKITDFSELQNGTNNHRIAFTELLGNLIGIIHIRSNHHPWQDAVDASIIITTTITKLTYLLSTHYVPDTVLRGDTRKDSDKGFKMLLL